MAGRPKGQGKTGGRGKGTPNKRTREFQDALEGYQCSLAEHIAALLKQQDFPAVMKAQFIQGLLPYLYPQRKPIDPEGYVTVEQAMQMQRELIGLFQQALRQHAMNEDLVTRVLASLHTTATNSH